MNIFELAGPWLLTGIALGALRYLEGIIHRDLYRIGRALSDDKERATFFYYAALFPGVFLHEFVQWLLAGALFVKTLKLRLKPRKQSDGTLRFNFVRFSSTTDRWRLAVLGAVPLIVGLGVVLFIARSVFDVSDLAAAFATGELLLIGEALGRVLSVPFFPVWIYFLFAVANTMLPTTDDDREAWKPILGVFAGMALLLFVAGFEEKLVEILRGPVEQVLGLLTFAFVTTIALDLGVIALLRAAAWVLERFFKRELPPIKGSRPPRIPKRRPGSNITPAVPVKRFIERPLPVPHPDEIDNPPRPAGQIEEGTTEDESP
jgi:hypothetical protein